jgi:hypothetical protein
MDQEKILNKAGVRIALIAGLSLILGAVVQWIFNLGNFVQGFLAGSLLFFCIGVLLLVEWRAAGGGKALAWIIFTTFIIRLLLGVFLAWGLPRFGYDQDTQQAGYVFEDAYRRDHQAWALVQSDQSLVSAFGDEYITDQYGGMLALSACIYRFLSVDAHRPLLISILAAGAMALSLPFFFATVHRQFGNKIALISCWVLALYPEGVLLGSSQMREPFYILFITVIFWAAANWLDRRNIKMTVISFLLSVISLLLFSFRVALPVLGAILLWVWVVEAGRLEKRWIKYVGWGGILLGSVVMLLLFKDWVHAVTRWDTYLTVRWSGMVQALLERVPENFHLPFIILYGVFQPLLPAALVVPGPWIWRSLGILRALGWYAMLPLLIHAVFRLWKAESATKKRWLLIMAGVVVAWTLIASTRAGGDQWDNPRYRMIFLPWMALLAGWGIHFARTHKDRWLTRILLIEGIFITFFTAWYCRRYMSVSVIPDMSFQLIAVLVFGLSLLVIVIGLIRDRMHPNPALTQKRERL